MKNATLRGKPDAGNPHVAPTLRYGGTGRFDEGEVASAKPRRGSRPGNRKLLVAACCCALALAGLAAHDVSSVDELVTALAAVNGGDSDTVIRIAPGTYDVSGCAMDEKGCLAVTKNVTIEGTDATCWRDAADRNTKVVLDAKYALSVFNVDPTLDSVKMRHLMIQNGTNTNTAVNQGGGAGIQHGWYGGKYITCSNCVFRNNLASSQAQGGGGHLLNVYNCYFTNNYAREGGAVLGTQYTRDCLFEYNRAFNNGGALRNGCGLLRCVFIGNSAANASCDYAGGYSVQDCVCISNTASAWGCFTSENWNLTVKNSRFEGNRHTANNPGGALTRVKLATNCVFVGNLAPRAGGAIYVPSNVTQIVDCFFTNNVCTSTTEGGGAVAGESGALRQPFIRRCDFYGNSATNNGGAVYNVVVTNSTFTADVAQFGSGASMSAVTDCTFTDCAGRQYTNTGFGGACHGGAVTNSVFRDCTGAYGAGGNGTTMTGCTFVGCAALHQGGAAYNSTLVDCVVSNCTAVSCDVPAGVGAESGGCDVTRVTFVDCHCATNADFTVAAGSCRLTDCAFVRCTPRDVKSATRCRIAGSGVYQKMPTGTLLNGGAWTNCLVTGVVAQYLFSNVLLVNCTIVSNNYGATGQLFANTTRAVNCIFRDNYHNAAGHFDVAGYGQWYFTNCVYKTHPNWNAYTFHDVGQITKTANLFLAPTHPDYDPQNPYALAPTAAARNAGVAVAWPDGATDLAGNPRVFLRDGIGAVDVGCYEYCRLSPATLLIFR